MKAALLTFLAAHPAALGALLSCVVWPAITGGLSLFQVWMVAKHPRAWAVLKAAGLDLPGFVRALRAPKGKP